MPNVVRAEVYRLRHAPMTWIVLVIATVSAVAYVWLAHLLAEGRLAASAANSGSVFSDVMIVYLLGALLIGAGISSDFESRAVHDQILAHSRADIVAAKTVTSTMTTMALVLPYGLVALIAFLSGMKVAPFLGTAVLSIASNEAGLSASPAHVARVCALIVVTALIYAARLAVCIPLAFVVKKPVIVMAFGFGWNFLADFLASLADGRPVIGHLAAVTPYARNYELTLTSSTGTLLAAAGVSVLFIVAMGVLTHLLFRRSEIK